MARYATMSDTERIVELAREEHKGSKFAGMLFAPEAVRQTVYAFIHEPRRTLLVTEHGYLFGLIQPMGFSSELAALEYAWFSKNGEGMVLFVAFDEWAKRMGASQVVLHDYTEDGRLGQVLQRRFGFNEMGTVFMRKPGIRKEN
jgi:hypothetical protein